MRFDYTTILSAASDTGEPMILFRPEIPVTVHGPQGSGVFIGLVDTGADNTILPEAIARELGISLISGKGPKVRAFGGQEIGVSLGDVELECGDAGNKVRWKARVHFVSSDIDSETIVLGHQGFLDYFTAKFIGEEFALELEPNSHLPIL